ncbi:MAG: creatininase family protein [Candidatus Wallbacteria bacterium]|nr:creatininase family protein [Candidatus Wallbacteria bacterium]
MANLLRLEELTWRALLDLPRDQTIVFVPISPIEEHGPHLPLGCDLFDAEAFAMRTSEELQRRRPGEWTVVMYPRVPLGTDTFAYLGSIEIRQRVVRDLAVDIGKSLSREGFNHVVFFNGHGGPAHNVALEEACVRLRRCGVRAIAPFGAVVERLFLGEYNDRIAPVMAAAGITELPLPLNMDYHAGAFETSLMLYLNPHLVTEEYRRLEPFSVKLLDIRPSTALREGPGLGYLGAPSAGNAKLGEGLMALVSGELATLVEGLADGQNVYGATRCKLYWVPLLWTDRYWYAAGLAMAAALLLAAALR